MSCRADPAQRQKHLQLATFGDGSPISRNAASQLTGINYALGTNLLGNLTYGYDAAGRRTLVGGSFARTGIPNALTSASYNADNQLMQFGPSSLSYDGNGNLISDGENTYTWNARNQLAAISGQVSASFAYDAFGRRISRTIGAMSTEYLYDGVNPVEEFSGGAASATMLTGGVDEYFQRTDPSGTFDYLTDAVGSTVALAGPAGALGTEYTYEPFGKTTTAGPVTQNPIQFTGRENDATGLYFYRARYYSPTLQRFISEDPIGVAGGANFYTYADSSPCNRSDPLGLAPCGATVPAGADARAVLDAVLGEASPLSKEGTRQYQAGDKYGHPTGSIVTSSTLYIEQTLITDTILNRARKRKESLEQVVSARRQFLGYKHGANLLRAIGSSDGSAECRQLRSVVGVYNTETIVGVLDPVVTSYRGIVQTDPATGRTFVRTEGGALRFAGTDFLPPY